MNPDSNPDKAKKSKSTKHHDPNWNFDPRNENWYLGKINKSGDNDLNMRYYTDGETGRYYRKGEIIPTNEPAKIVQKPFLNNSYEGEREKNFNFSVPDLLKRKKK